MKVKTLINIIRYLFGKPCRARFRGWDFYNI